jgi:hypothetical protein
MGQMPPPDVRNLLRRRILAVVGKNGARLYGGRALPALVVGVRLVRSAAISGLTPSVPPGDCWRGFSATAAGSLLPT